MNKNCLCALPFLLLQHPPPPTPRVNWYCCRTAIRTIFSVDGNCGISWCSDLNETGRMECVAPGPRGTISNNHNINTSFRCGVRSELCRVLWFYSTATPSVGQWSDSEWNSQNCALSIQIVLTQRELDGGQCGSCILSSVREFMN